MESAVLPQDGCGLSPTAMSGPSGIHRWTARWTVEGSEGVTGALIRARIRVDGRLASGPEALWRHRWWPAVAVASGMGGEDAARDPRGRGRELAGTFGFPDGGRLPPPSGREWQGSQLGQGTIELGFPVPALGEMQGEAARRAGVPSRQGEEPPPEGLGGHHLLTQTDSRCPAGQVVGHHLHRQRCCVGGEAA